MGPKSTHQPDLVNGKCHFILSKKFYKYRSDAGSFSPYFDWENIKINYETLFTISSLKIVFSIQG